MKNVEFREQVAIDSIVNALQAVSNDLCVWVEPSREDTEYVLINVEDIPNSNILESIVIVFKDFCESIGTYGINGNYAYATYPVSSEYYEYLENKEWENAGD